MTSGALYNEIDPFAAQWLRNLIDAGQIVPGVVDTRSIEDLEPDYVRQFTQVHLFAGIGIWSKALRRAGWPDDRRILTGSCPCQPFSAAGQGGGFADERHLWPAMFHLVTQCDFPVVVGEQVASKDGLGWLDLVHSDMEGAGYAFAALDTCAAGFGAPHIRQRLHWVGRRLVADAHGERGASGLSAPPRRYEGHAEIADDGSDRRAGSDAGRPETGRMAHPFNPLGRADLAGRDDHDGRDAGRPETAGHAGAGGGRGGLADADGGDASAERLQRGGEQRFEPGDRGGGEWLADGASGGRGIVGYAPQPGSGGYADGVGSSRVDLQACKLEYSIVSPK